MVRCMKDDCPSPPARRGAWRVLGWAMLVAGLAACGWSGWRAYDYRAAVGEARAAGFLIVDSPTPFAAIRADWRAALRLATWTERERRLFLPIGTDLAPLRPLLLRLDPTDLRAQQCRHLDALRGLTRLRILFLNGSDAKDLAPLADLAQLQRLSLHGCTGLGAEAVAAFKKSHPQVEVTDPETGLTFGYLRYTETQSNRIFVTVECLYGHKVAIAGGIKRIVKP